MRIKLFHLFVGIFPLIVISSCTPNNGIVNGEGSIEYAASVVDPQNPLIGFAPTKMIIKFKNNKSAVQMSAGMGLFNSSFISDPQQKTLTQIVKLLNKKVFVVQTASEIEKENALNTFELTHLKETKTIAGYNCQKAHIKYNDGSQSEFDVFYTTEIGIENPNFTNPFYMIDGVLMEYQMKKFGMEMKFTAKQVKKENVDVVTFQIPQDYRAISSEEMNKLFEGFQ